MASHDHGGGKCLVTRNAALDFVYTLPPSTNTMVSKSSVGMPHQRRIACPASDWMEVSRKLACESWARTNCTRPLHRLHTPSNSTTRSFGPTPGGNWLSTVSTGYVKVTMM